MLAKLRALLQGPPEERRLTDFKTEPAVAVCAVLLEAAETDGPITPAEQQLIQRLLRERFDLDEAAASALMDTARAELGRTPDAWPFTHFIRQHGTPEQKQDLLVMIWQVILQDQRSDPHEEQWARRLVEMLAVNQSVLIQAKEQARGLLGQAAMAHA